MGVINLTPDSFSDGGRIRGPDEALRHAERLVTEGADILDLGGESTRPGAAPVPAAAEIARVVPSLRAIRDRFDIALSADTRKPEVARAAIDAGADIVNDVSALREPEMARVVADAEVGVVLMHMRGTPETMQHEPRYDDVIREVGDALAAAIDHATAAGVALERIVVDPGIGFGKTLAHNLALISRLDEVARAGRPVLLGVSRKRFIGELLDDAPPDERLAGTIGACVAGLLRGARIFRVHEVRPVREALQVAAACAAGTAP